MPNKRNDRGFARALLHLNKRSNPHEACQKAEHHQHFVIHRIKRLAHWARYHQRRQEVHGNSATRGGQEMVKSRHDLF